MAPKIDWESQIGRRLKLRDLHVFITIVQRVPCILVVGDREAEADGVAVRRHGQGDEGAMAVDAFAQRVAAEGYTRAR